MLISLFSVAPRPLNSSKPSIVIFQRIAVLRNVRHFLRRKSLTFVVTQLIYRSPFAACGSRISRDVIGALKRHGLIDGALRAPEPGAPYASVTTKKFLEVFGLVSLRDLPDIEKLEDAGLLKRSAHSMEFDGLLGIEESDLY